MPRIPPLKTASGLRFRKTISLLKFGHRIEPEIKRLKSQVFAVSIEIAAARFADAPRTACLAALVSALERFAPSVSFGGLQSTQILKIDAEIARPINAAIKIF